MNKKKKFPLMPIFWLSLLVLLATKLIFDFTGFRSLIGEAFSFFFSVIGYLLYAFIIAYVLNAYMKVWENKILKKMPNKRIKRYLCILIAYVTLFALLATLIFTIGPTLTSTVSELISRLPRQLNSALDYYESILNGSRFSLPESVLDKLHGLAESLGNTIVGMLDVGKITNIFTSTIAGIVNVFMGLFVSVYMLLEKEKVMVAANNIVSAVCTDKIGSRIRWMGQEINGIFNNYFVGKLLQASIMLVVSYICFSIAGLNYSILYAVVMSITNLIPYLGPWIGGIPVVFISFINDPWKGVAAFICVLVAQGVDNFFVTPKVVGGKIGINPLLALAGLCIGGSLFGIVGMIVGDAMAAIVKVVFYDNYVYKKLQGKIESGELPPDYDISSFFEAEQKKERKKFKKLAKKSKKDEN